MATLRSDFLIHWTGKDIQTDYKALNDIERNEYVCRLRGTLNEGLWMTASKEEVDGYKITPFGYAVPMTCFTEIKLSATHRHTERYGCLGFGFSRDFVIERCGLPVQYVSGEDDPIVGNFSALWDLLKRPNVREQLSCEEFGLAMNGIIINIGFIKNMSECKFPQDFKYLDEAEWRIIHTYRREKEGKLIDTGGNMPFYKIPFKPCDLKVLILPDAQTRQQALSDLDILKWFGEPPDFPIIATVEECSHF